MAMLGKRQEDDGDEDLGGESVRLNLDDLVCPTCGRDLAPWMTTCPDDGSDAIDRASAGLGGVPEIPVHLLSGLDDTVAPADDDADDASGDAEDGVHDGEEGGSG